MKQLTDHDLLLVKYNNKKTYGDSSEYKGAFYICAVDNIDGMLPFVKRTSVKERRALLNYSTPARRQSKNSDTRYKLWAMLDLYAEVGFSLNELKEEYIDEDGKYLIPCIKPLIEGIELYIEVYNAQEETDG